MKIGIDARLIDETGVGRYIRNLIRELSALDTKNSYVVFLRPKQYSEFKEPNPRWIKRVADVKWHTFSEQIIMPFLYLKERLDIVHVPYFNAPIFYPRRFVLTIHDLTILHVDTGKASTLHPLLYACRRMGYIAVLTIGAKRARHIITVSNTVKYDIMKRLHIPSHVISVIYEGVDPAFSPSKKAEIHTKSPWAKYFLYVGNVYPHKNTENFLHAYEIYKAHSKEKLPLIMVGKDDFFYRRLKKELESRKLTGVVHIMESVRDEELRNLYSHAQALVLPSLLEGFGLPALEALSCGCPVLCSDIPIFHEIVGEYATYMNATNPEDMGSKLLQMEHTRIRPFAPAQVRSYLEKFSWKELGSRSMDVYRLAAS